MATARINLLPDIRQAKARAKQRRQTAAAVATILTSLSLGIVVVLFLVVQGQRLRIAQLSSQISSRQAQIDSDPDLKKIVTVQEHLKSIPALYAQRVYMTKFFAVLTATDPKDLAITQLAIDPTGVIQIQGTAKSYYSVSKFAEALEEYNVSLGPNASSGNQPFFTNVQIGQTSSDQNVSFTLSATMSPEVTSGGK